ncbi:MAG: hypothetical protein GY810_05435 [Aureispira sp.]|nr:hypothetical protein [Aureispira sp.]
MKFLISSILVLFFSISMMHAQDVIYKKDNTQIAVKVLEVVDSKIIKYKRFNNQSGPTYSIKADEVEKIIYENSTIESFGKKTTPKTTKQKNIDPELGANRNSLAVVQLLGMSGIISMNYEFMGYLKAPYVIGGIRAGIGFSNGSLHFPHSLRAGFGNKGHYFLVGLGGVFRVFLSQRSDIFEFLYGNVSKYAPCGIFGYRYQSKSGFVFEFEIPFIMSEDTTGVDVGSTPVWGITPWFGFNFGYRF